MMPPSRVLTKTPSIRVYEVYVPDHYEELSNFNVFNLIFEWNTIKTINIFALTTAGGDETFRVSRPALSENVS